MDRTVQLAQARFVIEEIMFRYAERLDAGDLEGLSALFARGSIKPAVGEPVKGAEEVLKLYSTVVKFYDAGKGFGFVVADDGGADVFLHGSVLGRAGLDAVEAGQQVSVMVTQGRRGLQATDIELL